MGEGKRGGQMVKSSYHIVWGRGTGRDAWSSEMYIYIYIWNDVSGRGDVWMCTYKDVFVWWMGEGVIHVM